MNRKLQKSISVLLCILLLFVSAGCSKKQEGAVSIIDGDFAEMQLFTQIARIMIEENTDYPVYVKRPMASSLAFEQIRNGEYDLYMCYDGSLLTAYLGHDVSEVPENMSVYEYADALGRKEANVMLLGLLGHKNCYVLASTRKTAKKYHLENASDVARHSSELRFAAEHEFFDEGSKHFAAFASCYDMHFKSAVTIDRGLKYVGLTKDNMDTTIVYTTDGLNKKFDLKLLEDDRGFFPQYNGCYLAREDLFDDYPELCPVFEKLEGKFSDEICTELNYLIDVENRDPYDVAYQYLLKEGLIGKK